MATKEEKEDCTATKTILAAVTDDAVAASPRQDVIEVLTAAALVKKKVEDAVAGDPENPVLTRPGGIRLDFVDAAADETKAARQMLSSPPRPQFLAQFHQSFSRQFEANLRGGQQRKEARPPQKGEGDAGQKDAPFTSAAAVTDPAPVSAAAYAAAAAASRQSKRDSLRQQRQMTPTTGSRRRSSIPKNKKQFDQTLQEDTSSSKLCDDGNAGSMPSASELRRFMEMQQASTPEPGAAATWSERQALVAEIMVGESLGTQTPPRSTGRLPERHTTVGGALLAMKQETEEIEVQIEAGRYIHELRGADVDQERAQLEVQEAEIVAQLAELDQAQSRLRVQRGALQTSRSRDRTELRQKKQELVAREAELSERESAILERVQQEEK